MCKIPLLRASACSPGFSQTSLYFVLNTNEPKRKRVLGPLRDCSRAGVQRTSYWQKKVCGPTNYQHESLQRRERFRKYRPSEFTGTR